MQNCPVNSRDGFVKMTWAASPMISGVRLARIMASPPKRLPTAAVAMVVRGHNALTATPAPFNSADRPSTHMLMPNFAML